MGAAAMAPGPLELAGGTGKDGDFNGGAGGVSYEIQRVLEPVEGKLVCADLIHRKDA